MSQPRGHPEGEVGRQARGRRGDGLVHGRQAPCWGRLESRVLWTWLSSPPRTPWSPARQRILQLVLSAFGTWLTLANCTISALSGSGAPESSRGCRDGRALEEGAWGSATRPRSVADLLVTLGKSPSLFAPQFPLLKHGLRVLFGAKILSFWSHLESSWPYFRQVVLKLSVLEPFSTLKDVQGPQRAFEFMWVN